MEHVEAGGARRFTLAAWADGSVAMSSAGEEGAGRPFLTRCVPPEAPPAWAWAAAAARAGEVRVCGRALRVLGAADAATAAGVAAAAAGGGATSACLLVLPHAYAAAGAILRLLEEGGGGALRGAVGT